MVLAGDFSQFLNRLQLKNKLYSKVHKVSGADYLLDRLKSTSNVTVSETT